MTPFDVRFCEDIFEGPTLKAHMESSVGHPQTLCPLSRSKGLPSPSYPSRGGSIFCLLLRGRPLAIPLAIRSVVMFSIEGVSWWPLPHVLKEDCKILPTWVIGNSFPPIPLVSVYARPSASRLHTFPRTVGWRGLSFRSMSMFLVGHVKLLMDIHKCITVFAGV